MLHHSCSWLPSTFLPHLIQGNLAVKYFTFWFLAFIFINLGYNKVEIHIFTQSILAHCKPVSGNNALHLVCFQSNTKHVLGGCGDHQSDPICAHCIVLGYRNLDWSSFHSFLHLFFSGLVSEASHVRPTWPRLSDKLNILFLSKLKWHMPYLPTIYL